MNRSPADWTGSSAGLLVAQAGSGTKCTERVDLVEEIGPSFCSEKTSVAFLAALAVLSAVGCPGGEGGDAANSVSVASSPGEAPEKSLTVQDLKTLALTADEVPGSTRPPR